MKTIKPNKEEVDSTLSACTAAARSSVVKNAGKFFTSSLQAQHKTRCEIFVAALDVIDRNYDPKLQRLVVHYEGRSPESAEYLEIQLCSKSDENDVLMAASVVLVP